MTLLFTVCVVITFAFVVLPLHTLLASLVGRHLWLVPLSVITPRAYPAGLYPYLRDIDHAASTSLILPTSHLLCLFH